jgi:undecaprenyl-diphosphatase
MTIFQALVLGIVQGLTEFLPISSSAHLALTPWVFGWQDPGLAFDVALHFGTLITVLWYFRKEWIALIAAATRIVRTRRLDGPTDRRVLFLILATIPGAIGGLLLEKKAETAFRAPTLIAINLIVMGIVLWLIDRLSRQEKELDAMKSRDAITIGLAQVLALLPGVSRSGATISAGRALKFNREAAAVFSFLMSMPIIAAAVIMKGPEAIRADGFTPQILVGVAAAAISSWLAIAVLLRYVSRNSYGIFGLYRIVAGLFILGLIAYRG